MNNKNSVFKKIIFFQEPRKKEGFILKENEWENIDAVDAFNGEKYVKEDSNADRKTKRRDKSRIKVLSQEVSNEEKEKSKKNEMTIDKGIKANEDEIEDQDENPEKSVGKVNEGLKINSKLEISLEYMKKVFNIPTSGDVIIREFSVAVKEKSLNAFIIFIDGMTDRNVININILQPLMLLSNIDRHGEEKDIGSYIQNHLLPQNQLKITATYSEVIEEVNFGGCGIFVEGSNIAFAADVKGWEHRGVERPVTELVIRGPQEGFNEVLRVNTALVRKILKDEDLVVESVAIGERSKTPCSMLYIKNIANDSLVSEVRRRLKSIRIDYLLDSGELEQLIEDSTLFPVPQVISTERPDKTASMLAEGKVAIIVNGSPFCLIVPATLMSLIHSPEDAYIRFPYANLLRMIRIFAIFSSLLLPGIYIAITTFHQEMIPTDLLLAIKASRDKLPFPSVIELLLMEVSFELIREAGIRIPGPIGPTLGIIGALILGQAAVAANIVSPILIIVVAVTGIGSFAIPDFSLGFGFRLTRFAYIFLGAMAGFLGITLGLFMHTLMFANAKSFGVPFLAPFAPKTTGVMGDEITRTPIWKNERRPDFLNPKDTKRQPHVSRLWTKGETEDKE